MARQWTGFGAPQDKLGAIAMWTTLSSFRADVPLSLKARAYASLAKGFHDEACENRPKTLNITRLYDAGNSANQAAALGLISPVILRVALEIEELGLRQPEDNQFPEHSTEMFGRLTDLWEVWDAGEAERAEENSRRDAKVSKDPLSYFCAAEDCELVATKKSTLRRCAGKCPSAFKPSTVRKIARRRCVSPLIP